jgi:hypothetical protein
VADDDDDWRNGLLPSTIRRATGPIYHYTVPSALLSEAEVKELWATEATGMNDLAEVRQGWAFVRTWLETQPDNWVTQQIRSTSDADNFAARPTDVFMCCASTEGDDANQWRLYSNGGRGYAVELDASVELAALARKDLPEPIEYGHRMSARLSAHVTPWLHVLYTDEEKRATLDGLATNALDDWAQLEADGFDSDEERDHLGEVAQELLIEALATVAQLMKSPGFAGEAEVRVIVTTFRDGCTQFRATPNGVIRYVRLVAAPQDVTRSRVLFEKALGGGKTIPITGVRLGPLLSAQNNTDTIKELLRRSGFSGATVSVSEVPLRG